MPNPTPNELSLNAAHALSPRVLLDAQAHLQAAAALLKLELTLEFAGFGQVMQCLLNPTEAFYRNAGGVSVILVRPKEIACAELREALEQYDRDPQATGQLCVVVCPQMEPVGKWTLDGPRWSKVLVLHAADLIETTPELFDAHSDAVAAVPYVDRLYESLSFVVMRAASNPNPTPTPNPTPRPNPNPDPDPHPSPDPTPNQVMRAASYLSRRPFKVVCVDCDNTLATPPP